MSRWNAPGVKARQGGRGRVGDGSPEILQDDTSNSVAMIRGHSIGYNYTL